MLLEHCTKAFVKGRGKQLALLANLEIALIGVDTGLSKIEEIRTRSKETEQTQFMSNRTNYPTNPRPDYRCMVSL